MNKKFLALVMSIVLILTSAAPVSAAEIMEVTAVTEETAAAEETDAQEDGVEEAVFSEEVTEQAAEEVPAAAEPAVEEVPAAEEPAVEEIVAAEEPAVEEIVAAEEPAAVETAEPEEEAVEELEAAGEVAAVGALSFTPADPEDGKLYIIHSAKNPGFVLDIANGSWDDKAKIQLYYNNGSEAQRFMFFEKEENAFVIMNLKTGKVFDAAGGSTQNRTQIQQYEGNNSTAQNWKFVKNEDGSYIIQSGRKNSQVIDVAGGTMKKCQKIQLYASNNSSAQKFYLEEVSLPDLSRTIMLRPSSSQRMAAVPAGYSNSHANLQVTYADGSNDYQLYTLEPTDHGFYTIRNVASGKVLDIAGGKSTPGTNVQLYTSNNSNAQKWRVTINTNGTYSFFSRLRSDLSLTTQDGGTYDGANIFVTTRGSGKQRYCTAKVEASPVTEVSAWIESALNSDRVLARSGSNMVSGDLTLAASQKLTVVPVHVDGVQDGYYVRLVASDGKVADVQTGKAVANQNVQFYQWNGTTAQLWHLAENSDGTYSIVSMRNTALCLDISNVSQDYGANIQLYTNKGGIGQKWHLASMQITSATIAASDHNTVTVKASGSVQKSDDGKAYLFAVEPYNSVISGKSPVASTDLSANITFTTGLNKDSSASLLQKKLYVAVKQNGIYRVISNAYYITNPEAAATNTTAFPSASRGTKKGLKLARNQYELAENLKCSHAIIDMPIEDFFNSNGDKTVYNYEGKNYTFYNVGNYIYQLKEFKSRGIVVTGIFYLSKKSLTNLMEPEARGGLNTVQYNRTPVIMGLNTKDANRKTLEALFACLAEYFTKDGYPMVANWIMGNEVDQFIQYNYSGNIGYNLYHETLAEQYRLFNASIKSRWANARCYISLDHNWNVSWNVPGTYQGMGLVSNFNTDLVRQGGVHWDMAMHPYPSPEQDCRFWNRVSTVTNSGDCGQITMLNASYWAAALKKTYGTGVHIIMSETGLSSIYNGTSLQNEQAAAVAYGYYLAEFDSNIDMFGIHRITDEEGETRGGWYLGILGKPAENVFRYMDTKNWQSVTSGYIGYVKKSDGTAASSWSQVVPGFNSSFLNSKS